MMKFTERENSRFAEVLERLDVDDFFDHLTGGYDFWGWWEEVGCEYEDDDIFLHAGATKVVIEIEDIGWVLKVDFDNTSEAYCELEADVYADAVAAGFEDFLAAEYFYTTKRGKDFYAQEIAIPDEDAVTSTCYEYYTSDMSEEEATDWWENVGVDCLDDGQRVAAMFDMSSQKLWGFIQFLEEHEVNDLHTGNFGYKNDGKVVIFDYSGYHG